MTALKEYQRLEGSGLWRAGAEAQRRDVIVSLGDATLTMTDIKGQPLAHWSLPAIARINPGERPALYSPDPDSGEDLEIEDDDFVAAMEKLRRAIEKQRPRHGRLRYWLGGAFGLVIVGLGVFWLPGALVSYTATVVPAPARAALGDRLAERFYRVAGRTCDDPLGVRALQTLTDNLLGPDTTRRLAVLSDAGQDATHLPGGLILLSRRLVEEQDGPQAVAGFVLAEDQRASASDPLYDLLRHAGLKATFRLLTTGTLPDTVLDDYAETLQTALPVPIDRQALLARFEAAKLPSTPYAFTLDPTGETTLPLIEADPVKPWAAVSPLTDDQWISLQGICAE